MSVAYSDCSFIKIAVVNETTHDVLKSSFLAVVAYLIACFVYLNRSFRAVCVVFVWSQ